MNETLAPLAKWHDDPSIVYALDLIRDGHDVTAALVVAVEDLAKRARYAEDYVLIHRLRG